jgi:hypothetical protein
MVCLRNICVNTLHKGDSIFTNNNNNNNNKLFIMAGLWPCILTLFVYSIIPLTGGG